LNRQVCHHINLLANNVIKAQKAVSQTNKVASGQPQATVVKALPVIPKKGVGTGVESIQKHTQQQQNFLMKASIASTGSKLPPSEVGNASTLPPIGSVIPGSKAGIGAQYGSTGANTRYIHLSLLVFYLCKFAICLYIIEIARSFS
jgi:phage shock protein PspC (stress-responsive transcriptional regulator)